MLGDLREKKKKDDSDTKQPGGKVKNSLDLYLPKFNGSPELSKARQPSGCAKEEGISKPGGIYPLYLSPRIHQG